MNGRVLFYFETRTEIRGEILVIRDVTEKKDNIPGTEEQWEKTSFLIYYLQICHVHSTGNVIKIMFMKSAWKYSRGRPRQGWINNIKNKM
jgi:hypothetical protein